jgi:hypothetical protein
VWFCTGDDCNFFVDKLDHAKKHFHRIHVLGGRPMFKKRKYDNTQSPQYAGNSPQSPGTGERLVKRKRNGGYVLSDTRSARRKLVLRSETRGVQPLDASKGTDDAEPCKNSATQRGSTKRMGSGLKITHGEKEHGASGPQVNFVCTYVFGGDNTPLKEFNKRMRAMAAGRLEPQSASPDNREQNAIDFTPAAAAAAARKALPRVADFRPIHFFPDVCASVSPLPLPLLEEGDLLLQEEPCTQEGVEGWGVFAEITTSHLDDTFFSADGFGDMDWN